VPAVHRALREAQERTDRRLAEVQLRESHKQLRALSVYLQHVREEERTRIAREVHDELGQALTSCKLDASWLAHHLPRNQKDLSEKAEKLTADIDSTIQTVRRISTELRPGILDYLGWPRPLNGRHRNSNRAQAFGAAFRPICKARL
jgi:signal transduction histidine kinase